MFIYYSPHSQPPLLVLVPSLLESFVLVMRRFAPTLYVLFYFISESRRASIVVVPGEANNAKRPKAPEPFGQIYRHHGPSGTAPTLLQYI